MSCRTISFFRLHSLCLRLTILRLNEVLRGSVSWLSNCWLTIHGLPLRLTIHRSLLRIYLWLPKCLLLIASSCLRLILIWLTKSWCLTELLLLHLIWHWLHRSWLTKYWLGTINRRLTKLSLLELWLTWKRHLLRHSWITRHTSWYPLCWHSLHWNSLHWHTLSILRLPLSGLVHQSLLLLWNPLRLTCHHLSFSSFPFDTSLLVFHLKNLYNIN